MSSLLTALPTFSTDQWSVVRGQLTVAQDLRRRLVVTVHRSLVTELDIGIGSEQLILVSAPWSVVILISMLDGDYFFYGRNNTDILLMLVTLADQWSSFLINTNDHVFKNINVHVNKPTRDICDNPSIESQVNIENYIDSSSLLPDRYCSTVRRTVYNVQCTTYSVQRTVYNVHCTAYSVRRTLYKHILYDVQCTFMRQLQRTVYGVCITMYILCRIQYEAAQSTVYSVHSALYRIYYTAYTVQCTMYDVRRTQYYIVYTVKCTQYTVRRHVFQGRCSV